MKIEIDNNTHNVAIVLIVAAAIIGIVLTTSLHYTRRMEAAFNGGYVENTTQGSGVLVWTKPAK